jgi:hypothetical protein
MAACGVIGAATVCGMVLAAPYIAPVQYNSARSPNHPMFAALAQGARNALTFSGGDGAGGALHSGSSTPGAGAPRQGAPVLGAGDDDGTSTQASANGVHPHGFGLTLGSLERISDVASNGGFAGGGYGGMGGGAGGGGFGGKGQSSSSLGSGDQSMGNSGTDDVGDVDLNSLADASSAHPLKAVASVVPEPSAWAMMILGVGMLGTVFRRRSALAATAAPETVR